MKWMSGLLVVALALCGAARVEADGHWRCQTSGSCLVTYSGYCAFDDFIYPDCSCQPNPFSPPPGYCHDNSPSHVMKVGNIVIKGLSSCPTSGPPSCVCYAEHMVWCQKEYRCYNITYQILATEHGPCDPVMMNCGWKLMYTTYDLEYTSNGYCQWIED